MTATLIALPIFQFVLCGAVLLDPETVGTGEVAYPKHVVEHIWQRMPQALRSKARNILAKSTLDDTLKRKKDGGEKKPGKLEAKQELKTLEAQKQHTEEREKEIEANIEKVEEAMHHKVQDANLTRSRYGKSDENEANQELEKLQDRKQKNEDKGEEIAAKIEEVKDNLEEMHHKGHKKHKQEKQKMPETDAARKQDLKKQEDRQQARKHTEDHEKHTEHHKEHTEDHKEHTEDHKEHTEHHEKHTEDHKKHTEHPKEHTGHHKEHTEHHKEHTADKGKREKEEEGERTAAGKQLEGENQQKGAGECNCQKFVPRQEWAKRIPFSWDEGKEEPELQTSVRKLSCGYGNTKTDCSPGTPKENFAGKKVHYVDKTSDRAQFLDRCCENALACCDDEGNCCPVPSPDKAGDGPEKGETRTAKTEEERKREAWTEECETKAKEATRCEEAGIRWAAWMAMCGVEQQRSAGCIHWVKAIQECGSSEYNAHETECKKYNALIDNRCVDKFVAEKKEGTYKKGKSPDACQDRENSASGVKFQKWDLYNSGSEYAKWEEKPKKVESTKHEANQHGAKYNGYEWVYESASSGSYGGVHDQ